jgi:hypothetical protein
MAHTDAIEISTQQGDKPLTPEQKRFNTLVKQIDKARKTIEVWQTNVPLYSQAAAKVLEPLYADLTQERKAYAMALDIVHGQPGLTRGEADAVREMLCTQVSELLNEGEQDDELNALFEKYNEVDFETERQQMRLAIKQAAQSMSGVDLGDDDIQSDADLFERLTKGMQQASQAQEAQQQQRDETKAKRAAKRGKTAAQEKRELEEQQATQSVREIFRQLASALHPDREPDENKRKLKTEMMQKANVAYNQNDLLTLLEMQLQLEQTQISDIANSSEQRLGSFNKVLTKQLAELKDEAHDLEGRFRHAFRISPYLQLNPQKLGLVIDNEAKQVRVELAVLKRTVKNLPTDKASLKKWIKKQSRHADEAMFDFF